MSRDDRTSNRKPSAIAPDPAGEGDDPKPEPTIGEMVRDQIGGVRGIVESAIPVSVFIVVNVATSLYPAIWSAVGAAIAIAIFRLVRRNSVRHAVNGLIGVGIAALFAARTGTAEGFYLPGIVFSYAEGAAFAISALVRRPVIGYAWALLTGAHQDWRQRPRLVRAYSVITLVWTAAFWTNSSIQLTLYFAEMPNALGVARLAGRSLYVAALAFTIWYGRRAARAEAAASDPAPAPA